jgi:hypothetical protein
MIPPVSVPDVTLGVYIDNRVDFEVAGRILDVIEKDLPSVKVVWAKMWEPEHSDVDGLLREIYKMPLDGADKILGLVQAPVGTMVAFLFVPVKLGATEAIHYDKAVSYTISQVAVHEVKHLLGWRH